MYLRTQARLSVTLVLLLQSKASRDGLGLICDIFLPTDTGYLKSVRLHCLLWVSYLHSRCGFTVCTSSIHARVHAYEPPTHCMQASPTRLSTLRSQPKHQRLKGCSWAWAVVKAMPISLSIHLTVVLCCPRCLIGQHAFHAFRSSSQQTATWIVGFPGFGKLSLISEGAGPLHHDY